MAVDLFNHPNFGLMKQTEELKVDWKNTAEDEWFHSGMPWATNWDYEFMNSNRVADETNIQNITQGYTTRLFDPNVTWGGNPSFTPSGGSSSHKWPDTASDQVYGLLPSTYTSNSAHVINGLPGHGMEFYNHSGNRIDLSSRTWSKNMMTLLPKHKRPPPRILVRAKTVPESGAVVTWTCMMEISVTVEIISNCLGYLPLTLSNAFTGWCGDNMFGMRTAPNGMKNEATNAYSDASTEGMSYKNGFRSGNYEVNTSNFPINWGRSDHFKNTYTYEEEDGDGNIIRGRRRKRVRFNPMREHENPIGEYAVEPSQDINNILY